MSHTAESLFSTFFLPLYPEGSATDLARLRSTDANPAGNPNILHQFRQAAEVFVAKAPEALGVPSEELALDFTDASVHRLSAALTLKARNKLANDGAAGTAENALFNFVIHGASYVGQCVTRAHDASWAVRRPLWESFVHLRSRGGEGDLPIFHWWLKSLADEAKSSLADRYRAHVEVPTSNPETRPILAPEDRPLPRLAKVRYDALYKYLRAHVPELRDVGEDFPSPERFDELKFAHLGFTLVGGGRMLLMHGPNAHGLHAFWLGASGFEKAAFWPCDKFPEPLLRKAAGDKLEVVLSRDGKVLSFEVLWWGP